MSDDDIVELIASAFHASYERLAPSYGYRTRDASAVPWEQVPQPNRDLMRAVVRELLRRGIIPPRPVRRGRT